MVEIKEKREKAGFDVQVQRMQSGTVGEILRAARLSKRLEYDAIAAEIHVRPAQLRAIEEGNIAALPGMTYALGFVRSYATHLRLNAPEIVQRFKAEHANVQNQAAHIPSYSEPVSGDRQQNWLVIGGSAIAGLIIVLSWTIFSNGSDDEATRIAETIPPAPISGTVSGIVRQVQVQVQAPTPATLPITPSLTEKVVEPLATQPISPQPAVSSPPLASDKTAALTKPPETAASVEKPDASIEVVGKTEIPKKKEENTTIEVKGGNGRIIIAASQSSWIDIRDETGKKIVQKLLHEGETYYVPDQSGLVLITGNAGGLDIQVDGASVQPLGERGEVMRGVALDPEQLKKVRTRMRRGQ